MRKLKKLLAVVTALALAVSMLSAISIADETDVYSIIVSTGSNGTVTSDVDEAAPGDIVTLTITPDEGYVLANIKTYQYGGGISYPYVYENSDGTYYFTMPSYDVGVYVTFDDENAEYFYIDGIALGTHHWYSQYDEYTRTITFEDDIGWSGWDFNKRTDPNLRSITISVGDIDFVNDTVDSVMVWVTYTDGTISENYLTLYANSTGTFVCDDNEIWYIWIAGGEGTVVIEDVSVVERGISYDVTVSEAENGTVTADVTEAYEDDTVTLTVTADDGYELEELTVVDGDNAEVTVTDNGDGTYEFTMPDSDVVVSASFAVVDSSDDVLCTFTEANEKYSFNYSDYLSDYEVGDTIVITATLISDSYYGGGLGANGVEGWVQETYQNGENYDDTVTVTLTVSSGYAYPYGGGQVQLWWIGGTYVDLLSLSLEKVESTDCTHDSLTHVEAVEATCTEDGNTEYWYCADCDTYFSDEDATTEITLDDTVVASTGHSYEEVVTEPTCTESGYTTHTCSACGDSYTDSETEALGHSYTSEVVKEPTCTENGLVTYTCSRCGDTYSEETEATGHSYEATDSSATCTEGGYTTYTCSVCGDTYTEYSTEALGHDYASEVTTEATCTEAGVMTYTCTRCGDSYTEEIPATGHTAAEAVVENEVAATCTTDGSYESVVYCSVCGEEISRETVTVEATGHTAAEAVTENEVVATCTTAGSYESVVYCSVCGEEISRETVTVEATGHSYTSEVTTEATCTEAGVMTYTCSVCGDSYTEEIAATGHTAGTAVRENVVEATTSTEGSYDLVTYCTVCGEELSRETVIVPAKGTDMVSVWLRTPANYTEVNNAIAKADALNPDDYTNFSDVTDAINAVDWSYNALMQAYVTDMANAIETAIANLIPVSATIEDITIVEPIESTDTDEEPDEDTSEPATPVETNPTTGIALSIIPIAIAALAAVSSKRR